MKETVHDRICDKKILFSFRSRLTSQFREFERNGAFEITHSIIGASGNADMYGMRSTKSILYYKGSLEAIAQLE